MSGPVKNSYSALFHLPGQRKAMTTMVASLSSTPRPILRHDSDPDAEGRQAMAGGDPASGEPLCARPTPVP